MFAVKQNDTVKIKCLLIQLNRGMNCMSLNVPDATN